MTVSLKKHVVLEILRQDTVRVRALKATPMLECTYYFCSGIKGLPVYYGKAIVVRLALVVAVYGLWFETYFYRIA